MSDDHWMSGRTTPADHRKAAELAERADAHPRWFLTTKGAEALAATLSIELREAARRVIEVVDEPSPQDDGTAEVEALWYLEWETRHREAVEALRTALGAADKMGEAMG